MVGPATSRKEKTSKTSEEGERQDDEPRDLGGRRRPAILPHHSTYSTTSRALSLTALRTTHHNTSLTLWSSLYSQFFARNPSSRRLRLRIDPRPPSAHTLRLHDSLDRRLSSLLVQLRSGRSHLKADLFRTRSSPTDSCECGGRETRQHFLLSCPLYSTARSSLRREVGKDAMDVSVLLTMHTDAALRFAMATGRFPRYHSGKLEEDQRRKKA